MIPVAHSSQAAAAQVHHARARQEATDGHAAILERHALDSARSGGGVTAAMLVGHPRTRPDPVSAAEAFADADGDRNGVLTVAE